MLDGKLKQRLILQRGAMSTLSLLLTFLLSITTFTFGSLYFEQVHKVKSLSAEVKQLKQSQVLLMVPDEQAEAMANWMANNPHFVQSFVDKAKQGESTVLPIGPGIQQKQSDQEKTKGLMMPDAGSASKSELEPKPKPKHKQAPESSNRLTPAKVNPASSGALAKMTSTANASPEPLAEREAVPEHAGLIKFSSKERAPKKAVTLTETAEGVKLISLPHGGIRVTTREPEE